MELKLPGLELKLPGLELKLPGLELKLLGLEFYMVECLHLLPKTFWDNCLTVSEILSGCSKDERRENLAY